VLWWLIIIGLCFVAFGALTSWFVIYNVGVSQHVWCHFLNLLNHPPGHSPVPKPGTYGAQLAKDFAALVRSLGC
jgi:hypothetical protein